MAKHNEYGIIGEEIAVSYLLKAGYRILERNWRIGHREIDIICEEPNSSYLIIVEVKSRFNRRERIDELIDYRKSINLRSAADAYVRIRNIHRELRFDLITITGENSEIEHIKEIITILD